MSWNEQHCNRPVCPHTAQFAVSAPTRFRTANPDYSLWLIQIPHPLRTTCNSTFLVNLLETQKSQRATTKCSRQPCFLQERFPATAETIETASTVLYFTVRVESCSILQHGAND
ncbi:unnamed protein product [Chondrus crispus]|uniref:Uncharacterized protein n=1 Tax=Chondrus crispus TaxID=2769 RepID=R7QMX6_CHOCR|nr:unnamed protein product [Chondrus crispus]CDF39118.1 unnamed protein product [Chondrus crispus]|eukprot:XP_005719029.1 unnamed protein product [Chondrus crispus]